MDLRTNGLSFNSWKRQLLERRTRGLPSTVWALELYKRFRLPAFCGIISHLSIDAGQICCGIFRGDGSIKFATAPFSQGCQATQYDGRAEASPHSAMQLRFNDDPYNELELQFSLNETVSYSIRITVKIIAYYEKAVKYGLFSESTAGKETLTQLRSRRSLNPETRAPFWNRWSTKQSIICPFQKQRLILTVRCSGKGILPFWRAAFHGVGSSAASSANGTISIPQLLHRA